jgi:tetratricopeptide (TPR) repeat protein
VAHTGVNVTVFGGRPSDALSNPIEVDVATSVPTAFGGLRRIVEGLKAAAPGPVDQAARNQPSVWNRLFPKSFPDAPDLSLLALSPSERRLHRESEQTFWVLNFGARLILDALATTGRPLVLRHTGQTDLVSLRAVMRASEWSRASNESGRIVLGEWTCANRRSSTRFEPTREVYAQSVVTRMRATFHPGESGNGFMPFGPATDDEERYLSCVVDASRPLDERVASAVLAIKATFFTTNYEGAMLAAETGLALLKQGGVNADRVVESFRKSDTLDNPAIEIAAHNLTTPEELRAVFLRSMGVIRSFTGDHDGALATFALGLECNVSPVTQATLRMYRALTLIKKMGQAEAARGELDIALEGLKPLSDQTAQLEAGWLRNVRALTYFSEKQFAPALEEEKKAIAAVGSLHDLSATHLKINLISNVSVLQESAKKYAEAIKTWHRFDNISAAWGEAFFKHHRYRSAGLSLASGERGVAEKLYLEAYGNAVTLRDAFHRQVISCELGRFYLEAGRRDDAVHWYDLAVNSASVIGDPFRMAESLAGQSLATQEKTFDRACELARQTSTYPKEADRLVKAAQSTDPASVVAVLPTPRSKLNRPFDLVNLFA